MPVPAAAPVAAAERIANLDVLRGVALCGILLMNIRTMSMPEPAYFFPYTWGDMTGVNGAVWYLTELLASSKFITLFSLLFGAGIVLMNDKARAAGRGFAGLHYRRMFYLLLIGMVHGYLIWEGDILASYAVCGGWAFLFRNRRPRTLIISGVVALLIGTAILIGSWLSSPSWPEEVRAAWVTGLNPSYEAQLEQVEQMTGGFADQMEHRFGSTLSMQTSTLPFYMIWRAGGTMLLGMALFKLGWLSGRARRRTYRIMVAVALLVGIPLTWYGIARQDAIGWEPLQTFFAAALWGYWASFATALGWLGLVMLWCGSTFALDLRRRFAALGRMALTNYLLQSVIGSLIFYGYGLALFGRVPHVGQLAICVGVWAVQLWWSPRWLARFRFGPVEWLWRSLSYRKRQPFRRKDTPAHAAS
jgi:uncharacterized protein